VLVGGDCEVPGEALTALAPLMLVLLCSSFQRCSIVLAGTPATCVRIFYYVYVVKMSVVIFVLVSHGSAHEHNYNGLHSDSFHNFVV
jgi:hypothetical protein